MFNEKIGRNEETVVVQTKQTNKQLHDKSRDEKTKENDKSHRNNLHVNRNTDHCGGRGKNIQHKKCLFKNTLC